MKSSVIATRNRQKAASALLVCCALLALAAFPSAARAQAGYVHEISGTVSIQRASAKAVAAKAGDAFESDTVFRSGADGKAILKFADGQIVALGPDSALRVGEYRYVARDLRQSSSTLELMKGEMRFVAGLIGAANRDGVRIIAGDSMIRILSPGGADFTVLVNPDPEEIGAVAVALGEVSVRTPYGPIYKIAGGQYVPWQPRRTLPPPAPIAAAPAVIQAAVADLWTTVVPVNTPVTVASAARMAAAVAVTNFVRTAASADPRQAGYVDTVSSNVSIRAASGKTASANAGDSFEAGATFNTGTDGRVVLKFADGQVVVLGPGSILGVDQYQFDPRDLKASRMALDLANGSMRYVTGVIHAEHDESVSISAGASLIDILNAGVADFTVVVNNAKGQEVGVAAVAAGEISVHTPYGPISKIGSGEAAPWQPGGTPALPEPLAAASADVQAGIAALAATPLPDNTPVIVAAAARAAAAVAAATRAEAAASAAPGNAQLRAAAQAAAEQANTATQAATSAAAAVAATVFAGTLAALPATAAGPARAPLAAAPLLPPAAPIAPTVTPGGGGTCLGSTC